MVEDLDLVVSEIRRTLRPGGLFLFYEHVASPNRRARKIQTMLNPLWRFATTGCNLDRDTLSAIRRAGFRDIRHRRFRISVGAPVITIPNIVGSATA